MESLGTPNPRIVQRALGDEHLKAEEDGRWVRVIGSWTRRRRPFCSGGKTIGASAPPRCVA
jgi:hypothetical protein